MRYRTRKECWFGRLFRQGEEAAFDSGTPVPESLFEPLETAPETRAGNLSGMWALRRQARDLGLAWGRTWKAADLERAIAAARQEARHGQ